MALGTDHVILSEVGNFVPELWSDEVVAAYKSNLVFANLVRKLNHRGKKGDTVRIPTPARGSASDKASETQVTLQQHGTDTGIVVSIDKHKEYSRLIEDIVATQALESLRRFYTDDAGYAIAAQIDLDLIIEMLRATGNTINTNAAQTSVLTTSTFTADFFTEGDGSAWDEAGTPTAISDAGIRAYIRILDLQDVPMADRAMVVDPLTKEDLLGVQRFTEEAFVGERAGGNSIRNGMVGNLYGMPVYVTNQLPTVENSSASATAKLNFVVHKDAAVLVEQMGVRSQSQYKQEYLAHLYTSDTLYGTKLIRDGSVVPFVTPSTA